MVREMRYWKIKPARNPGDEVAAHDGGVGVGGMEDQGYASGPGNYQVVVRRPRSTMPGQATERWPIELRNARDGALIVRFNRGMARWFGLRLIEAAGIAEAFDVEEGGAPSMAVSEVDRLATWLQNNAADRIKGSAVDTAIAIIEEYKTRVGAGELQPSTPAERAIEALRGAYQRAIEQRRTPVTLEARAIRTQALGGQVLTTEQFHTEVIDWFSPSDQGILRGLGLA